MRKESIKKHLKPYSILQRRKTTLNHAFASAIAPTDSYDESRLNTAIRVLSQNPDDDLLCVYCGRPAMTWDHLVGLVENSQLRGYGHQMGNLVPCCGDCNEEKGSKDWQEFLKMKVPRESQFELKRRIIISYLRRFATPIDLKEAVNRRPRDWKRYEAIKKHIFDLMREADEIAKRLREIVARRG